MQYKKAAPVNTAVYMRAHNANLFSEQLLDSIRPRKRCFPVLHRLVAARSLCVTAITERQHLLQRTPALLQVALAHEQYGELLLHALQLLLHELELRLVVRDCHLHAFCVRDFVMISMAR